MAQAPQTPVLVHGIPAGLLGGAIGTAVMTLGEKLEQRVTGRPDSYVPGRVGERLFKLRRKPAEQRKVLNEGMHWATGISVGVLRGIMSAAGLRGPWASGLHTVIRLTADETMHGAAGVSTPPWTWPKREIAVDVGHKAVYAFATGYAVDRLVRPVHPFAVRKARQASAAKRR